jgi:hypothetical protein
MVQIPTQVSDKIRFLCEKALDGSEKLDYYWQEWPTIAAQDTFLDACKEDILNCVEHTPRGIFTHKTPIEWYGSDEYLAVYLDYVLLSAGADSDALYQCRESVMKRGLVSRGDINCDVGKRDVLVCPDVG